MSKRGKKDDATSMAPIKVHPISHDPTVCWEKLRVKQRVEKVSPLNPYKSPLQANHVRFVCVSDTHSRTNWPQMKNMPDGDVLLHAGDFTMHGLTSEISNFNEWLSMIREQI